MSNILLILIDNIVLQLHTRTSLTEFAVFVGLCVCTVEIFRRNIRDKLLVITDCAMCWIKYCITILLHEIWITLNKHG